MQVLTKRPLATLRHAQAPVLALQLVDEPDAAHGELAALRFRHVAQGRVEAARPEEEAAVQQHAAVQLPAGAVAQQFAARGRAAQRGERPGALGVDDAAILQPALAAEHAHAPQHLEIRARQRSAEAVRAECGQQPVVDLLAGILVEHLLQARVRIDPPPQDAGAVQVEEAIDEHLRAGIQALLECAAAAYVQRRAEALGRVEELENVAELVVLLVPQLQPVDHRVTQLADAQLQRAAVAHQRRAVQADGVLDGAEPLVRRREQVEVVARIVEQGVKGVGRHHRRPIHDGMLRFTSPTTMRSRPARRSGASSSSRSRVTSGLEPRLYSAPSGCSRRATSWASTFTPRAATVRATCV